MSGGAVSDTASQPCGLEARGLYSRPYFVEMLVGEPDDVEAVCYLEVLKLGCSREAVPGRPVTFSHNHRSTLYIRSTMGLSGYTPGHPGCQRRRSTHSTSPRTLPAANIIARAATSTVVVSFPINAPTIIQNNAVTIRCRRAARVNDSSNSSSG